MMALLGYGQKTVRLWHLLHRSISGVCPWSLSKWHLVIFFQVTWPVLWVSIKALYLHSSGIRKETLSLALVWIRWDTLLFFVFFFIIIYEYFWGGNLRSLVWIPGLTKTNNLNTLSWVWLVITQNIAHFYRIKFKSRKFVMIFCYKGKVKNDFA